MKQILSLIILCFSVLATQAQHERYIEVTGSAELELTPDIIVILVKLKEYDENKEKISLEKIDRTFMNAVSKSNIAKKDISLADITLNAVQRRKERDYYAQKSYQVTFSKAEELMAFMDNLENVKVNFLSIIKLSHTEIEKFRLETKVTALKAAEQKAGTLLQAVGSKRGKAILIKEDPAETFDWRPNNDEGFSLNANVMRYQSSPEEESIPFKKIKLRYLIQARFEIE